MSEGTQAARIGFVGLGAMGGRIAGRLLAAGHEVHGYNRTRAKAEGLIERGLIWRASPREVAAAADIVFSMVTDDAALTAIASGSDGILAGLAPGKVYVDMSTVGPQASRALADEVRQLGAAMLDAPVSGSVHAAEEGRLSIMVGGEERVCARVEPLLRQLGSTVTRVGANGQALLMKLAVNINLAQQMLAFSEGVLLAERGGIDRTLAVEVMIRSAIGSPMLLARGPLVVDLPDEAWFDVRLMQKDVGLALDAGRTLAVPLPGTAVANQLLTAARALGRGEQDIAVLFQVLAEIAGGRRASRPEPLKRARTGT
jgi:3-hydroxyisobutyrate dehydrogenase-like beta-hydroxyacid dehydrogenase